mmetsp:Transcript_104137/g.325440  ORF Transcript_104137/g.325440 Transcript_104137/m.325440 type:complete len:147 (+) Transcript_104137:108-548(+)
MPMAHLADAWGGDAIYHPRSLGSWHHRSSFQNSGDECVVGATPKLQVCYHYPGEDPRTKVWRPPLPDHGMHKADIPDKVHAERLRRLLRLAQFFGTGVLAGGVAVGAHFFQKALFPAGRVGETLAPGPMEPSSYTEAERDPRRASF